MNKLFCLNIPARRSADVEKQFNHANNISFAMYNSYRVKVSGDEETLHYFQASVGISDCNYQPFGNKKPRLC